MAKLWGNNVAATIASANLSFEYYHYGDIEKSVSIRDVVVQIDEPVERGGTNLGPAPTETAIAALIGCTNTIGHKCANSLGLDIGNLIIDAVCDFDRRGVTLQEEIDVPFQL